MPYKITITKITSEEVTSEKKWGCVGYEYMSGTDYEAGVDFADRKSYKRLDNGQYEKAVYDYLPPEKTTKQISTELYSQTVSDLIVEDVIKSVLSASSPKIGQMIPVTKDQLK